MRNITPFFFAFVLASQWLLGSAAEAQSLVYPQREWTRAEPSSVGLDRQRLIEARDYALTGGGSGYIVRHGKLVMSWGDAKRRYDLKSTSKSIGVTALGLAIDDGLIKLSDRARSHQPTLGTPPAKNADTGWLDEITILHLATQTAGFEKPGGFGHIFYKPGTRWSYSDGGPNWLAESITLKYRRDLKELMFERVFSKIGITEKVEGSDHPALVEIRHGEDIRTAPDGVSSRISGPDLDRRSQPAGRLIGRARPPQTRP